MKKDAKRLRNELLAIEHEYFSSGVEDKPRLLVRRLAAINKLYQKQAEELANVGFSTLPETFLALAKSAFCELSGARRMKALMEAAHGN